MKRRYKLIFSLTPLVIFLVIIASFVIENIFLPSILAGRQYPVEVVSIREIESRTDGDNVSTLYEYTIRICGEERTIRMVKFDKISYGDN